MLSPVFWVAILGTNTPYAGFLITVLSACLLLPNRNSKLRLLYKRTVDLSAPPNFLCKILSYTTTPTFRDKNARHKHPILVLQRIRTQNNPAQCIPDRPYIDSYGLIFWT